MTTTTKKTISYKAAFEELERTSARQREQLIDTQQRLIVSMDRASGLEQQVTSLTTHVAQLEAQISVLSANALTTG